MAQQKTLIFIIGPQAAGKMTVGQELSRATGLKFMHNHQTIDLLLPIFEFGSAAFERLVFDFRLNILHEVASSDLPGIIFSCVHDFDSAFDRAQLECFAAPFLKRGGQVLYVELAASLETRIARNRSENRLHHKPLKRDLEFAEQLVVRGEKHRCNSDGEFPYPYPHLKVVNDDLSPAEVVRQICDHFQLLKRD